MLKKEDKITIEKIIIILEKIEFPKKLDKEYKNIVHAVMHLKIALE